MKRILILCATRDATLARWLCREMDDAVTCSVRCVRRGDDALHAARREAPDILVVDAVLPGMDGLGVIDRMRAELGSRMPRVIAGSTLGFATGQLRSREVDVIAAVPWEREALRAAVAALAEDIRSQVCWERAQADYEAARALLSRLGMRERLTGFAYLAWAAALACESEDRLFAVGKRIYAPIAQRYGATPQNVERLIRHAVERTMDTVGAQEIYGFFGNTIDPTRGKPTNGQMIGMLAQRLRVS